MAVAPGTGGQFDGTYVSAPHHYCVGILGRGPAHVVLDGFTFETPGVTGVYVEASHVTVRRSWFRGCHAGVTGNYTDKPPAPVSKDDAYGKEYITMRLDPVSQARAASDIVIEYCDFTQFPTFEDAVDSIRAHGRTGMARKSAHPGGGGLPTDHFKYEIGIAARIARNWVIRHNLVHSVFDGLSCHAVSASQGLRVEENVFQGVVDNGVESEDHAQDLHLVRNVFVDNFMPFSYQPIRGTPWPGPVFFVQNVVTYTSQYRDVWSGYRTRKVFKIHPFQWKGKITWLPHMAGAEGEQPVPEPGLVVAHNTVLFPGGLLGIPANWPHQRYVNNLFVVSRTDRSIEGSQFRCNAVAPAAAGEPGPSKETAGNGGFVLPNQAAARLDAKLRPTDGSPLRDRAVPVPQANLNLADIGAVQTKDTWYPLAVGPLACKE